MRMDGKNAIVTGASLGLGLAIARSFAQAGANVVVAARREDALAAAKAQILAAAPKAKVVTVSADVGKAADCTRLYETAVSQLGRVDVLVNNAGTSRTGKFVTITDEVWQEDLDLKLFAAIRLSRLAFPGMCERKWGRIINVLNVGAKAPKPGGAPTAVSRAAGMALMKILSGEGAPHNVLVNGLLVGKIESDQWVRRHSAETGTNRTLDQYYEEAGKELPMGRMGKAQEFANMALFLASDAGSYITGTAINVDGGLSPVV